MNIPILFTTFNRLEYTKKALHALMESDCGDIYIFDNGSTDDTIEWLENFVDNEDRLTIHYNDTNVAVVGAMNHFFGKMKGKYEVVGKVDNDTIVPKVWCAPLVEKMQKCHIDIIQAKHPILQETYNGASFDAWMKTMMQDEKDPSIFYSSFVGGSGMLCNLKKMGIISSTDEKLVGWTYYQRFHPLLVKAFCDAVEIDLLDMHKEGGANYEDKNYYKETGRL